MNNAFLKQLSQYLLSTSNGNMEEVVLIMPGRRPFVYLKHYISQQVDRTVWLPEMYTIEDISKKISGLVPGDNIDLLFSLFHACTKVSKEPVIFSDFLKWGPIALSDFNEIDSHLANREKLYTYLEEARVLEVWNPGEDHLTDFQKKYLAFWNSMGAIHKEFVASCMENGEGYDGLLLRLAAEKEELPEWLKGKRIIIAGFNAFTPAEEKIISRLLAMGAEEFFDADTYYLDDPSQEAGKFLREHKKTKPEKAFNFTSSELTEEKEIHITGVAGEVLQGKLAGSIVSKISGNPSHNVAVVLGDEGLLLPLLNSLPVDIPVNVTMGFPLSASPVYRLFKDALDLIRTRTGSGLLHYASLTTFFSNPALWILAEDAEVSGQKIIRKIREYNKLRVTPDFVLSASENSEFIRSLDFLLRPEMSPVDILIELTGRIISSEKQPPLLKDQIYHLNLILVQLKDLLQNQEDHGIKIFSEILEQLVRQARMPFQGEPLEGIQVMGFLESRLLDFETLILAGVNEGVVPSGKTAQTFIPWDIRKSFGLFTYHDKDAIFAYHFYRLLQRSKSVHLIYSTSKDETGGGEKSRFISQIESELTERTDKVKFHHNLLTLSAGQPAPELPFVDKTNETSGLVLTFLNRGVSPSALNTFLTCPLDFFYSYLLRITEESEVEEEVEASSMGTFIHDALEKMLQPYVGRQYDFSEEPDLKQLTKEAFRKKFSDEDLSSGKNHIALTLATTYLSLLQNTEKSHLSEKEKPVILELEAYLRYQAKVGDTEVLFKGTADRVERSEGKITLIDYKTGKVEPKELMFEEISELFDGKKPKALQLAFYAWLYSKNNPGHLPLRAAIISFRKLNQYQLKLEYKGSDTLDQEFFAEFEEHLYQVIHEIQNPVGMYQHNEESLYCNYCQ